jgi:hypothetical protein
VSSPIRNRKQKMNTISLVQTHRTARSVAVAYTPLRFVKRWVLRSRVATVTSNNTFVRICVTITFSSDLMTQQHRGAGNPREKLDISWFPGCQKVSGQPIGDKSVGKPYGLSRPLQVKSLARKNIQSHNVFTIKFLCLYKTITHRSGNPGLLGANCHPVGELENSIKSYEVEIKSSIKHPPRLRDAS